MAGAVQRPNKVFLDPNIEPTFLESSVTEPIQPQSQHSGQILQPPILANLSQMEDERAQLKVRSAELEEKCAQLEALLEQSQRREEQLERKLAEDLDGQKQLAEV